MEAINGSFKRFHFDSLLPPVISLRKEEDYDQHGLKWQKTKRFAEDTKHRKKLISWVKWVVSLWLIAVMTVLMLNNVWFRLEPSVLITLLTTTTVNILGLAYIVLKGLFDLGRDLNNSQ